jgi:hypothetical protein
MLESELRTGFGEVEFLFEKVRHQPEQSDEAAQGGAHNVEIGEHKGRHDDWLCIVSIFEAKVTLCRDACKLGVYCLADE